MKFHQLKFVILKSLMLFLIDSKLLELEIVMIKMLYINLK